MVVLGGVGAGNMVGLVRGVGLDVGYGLCKDGRWTVAPQHERSRAACSIACHIPGQALGMVVKHPRFKIARCG